MTGEIERDVREREGERTSKPKGDERGKVHSCILIVVFLLLSFFYFGPAGSCRVEKMKVSCAIVSFLVVSLSSPLVPVLPEWHGGGGALCFSHSAFS